MFREEVIRRTAADTYDIVPAGGRVIAPETGLDAVRIVGLRGERLGRRLDLLRTQLEEAARGIGVTLLHQLKV